MKELSLFTGAGGGVLGSKILGWKTIGYVEYEKYCQKIIKQRIADGILDSAPIFGDIRSFISEGYAAEYKGMVDIITGGFPCQPFSVAGKKAGENDPRNMWPSTIECIRIIRPRFAFLENVPGILTDRYMGRIFGDLADSGYDCRWTCLGADDVGANHRRKRLWIFAYPKHGRMEERRGTSPTRQDSKKLSGIQNIVTSGLQEKEGQILSNPIGLRQLQSEGGEQNKWEWTGDNNWWSTEPGICRVAYGVANGVHRRKMLGNGQVPLTMAYAFSKLSEGIIGE